MRLLLLITVLWKFPFYRALTCLKCDDVVQPRHCTTVMTCPDTDVCFVERRINSFGEEGYALGCMRDHVCRNITSISSTSRCAHCCIKDLCNQEGCGEPGYPDSRGPICYNCLDAVPEGRCHQIEICRQSEVCSVSGKGMFGTTVFASKCIQQESCGAHHGVDIIGKRGQMSAIRAYDVHDCFQCCTSDLCNRNCHNSVDGQWGTWGQWSMCDVNCNHIRIRSCNNPAPEDGGRNCRGLAVEVAHCSVCLAKDCSELLVHDARLRSGVYNITTPLTHTQVQVYCDMDTDGGGWTIFQRRFNGSVDFYRNFSDYENGFGNVAGEYWLGLKYIYEITSNGSFQLRVNITHGDGSTGYDVYSNFSLQHGTNYTLNLGERVKSQGVDSSYTFFTDSAPVGNAFSTYDLDRDNYGPNCAETFKGGWWYNACYRYINLNGLYKPGRVDNTAMLYDNGVGLTSSTIMFKDTFQKA
ncbi:uncharacterized protein LOC127845187 [Dreissena polymorpha]|uniref:Fibrinogen C-terminal domain-containing protein n=1 Tax=Dreissena polymorpha TaxID=45954 RepID=A0A9D4EAS9_DREPO|nr:uncharacterized protein LOC127845187 [Dreissena polymorpha]KAH3776288.1 hypothetical protein DPMN_177709 [Dreissena polymorpha]